jgi:hypothetical protein
MPAHYDCETMWPFKRKQRLCRRVREFLRECYQVFDGPLAAFGFLPTREWTHSEFAAVFYRNGDRYVEVSINTHLRDGPEHCTLSLGQGSDEWPETDWNKVALRQLMPQSSLHSNVEPYTISLHGSVVATLEEMRKDLLRHAEDFLRGSMERFLSTRRKITRLREPYKIYSPSSSSLRYTRRDDPESAALKDRFSRE